MIWFTKTAGFGSLHWYDGSGRKFAAEHDYSAVASAPMSVVPIVGPSDSSSLLAL